MSTTVIRQDPVEGPLVARLLGERGVRSVYQPIIDLHCGETVAYEALARGPAGSALERPDRLFAAARMAGLSAEVEWECQRAALEGALEGGLGTGRALFMNLEPGVLDARRPDRLTALLEAALDRFPVFVELTERSLTSHPSELLAAVERLRGLGVGIALDDVGVDPRSLALMPFLAPDVIKLDLTLVQRSPSGESAEVIHAVGAEAERTGALILAEGIETEAHLQTAVALGARYGQGFMLGRPESLPGPAEPVGQPVPAPRAPERDRHASPFEIVARHRPVQRGDKRLLLALSRQIEANAAGLGAAGVLLSSFQQARYFTSRTASRYTSLSEVSALVGAIGVGLAPEPAAGVRGVPLDAADPVCGEWDVTLVGPHFAMAFVARDLGDAASDMQRRFDFAVTYDRDLAIVAAHALMSRVTAV